MKKIALFTGLFLFLDGLLSLLVSSSVLSVVSAQPGSDCLGPIGCPASLALELGKTEESLVWYTWPVDVPKGFDIYSNRWLAVDTAGRPHMAYGGIHLHYATYDGMDWVHEVVDGAASVGAGAVIALDSAGRPHIAYVDSMTESLKYASRTGDSWQTEVVADTTGWAQFDGLSLALDSADVPGIAFLSPAHGLYLARPAASDWATQEIVAGYHSYPSLAFDAADRPLVAYADRGSVRIGLASWTGSAWDNQIVFESLDGYDMRYPSLAIGQDNQPRIAFVFEDNDDWGDGGQYLEYAAWDGMAWMVEEIGPTSTYFGAAMVLDSSDRAHIVTGEHYAHQEGQAWTVETLAGGYFPAIALDPADQLCAGYYGRDPDTDDNVVAYLHRTGEQWMGETVDQTDERTVSNQSMDVAVAPDGTMHLSYVEELESRRYLVHTRRTAIGWQTETIGLAQWEGRSTLALDSQGWPIVAFHGYHDSGTVDLARWTGTAWQTEIVDAAGPDGPLVLQLDSQDRPHLAYGNTYAVWNGSAWEKSALATPNSTGPYWLDLDSHDRPHLIYNQYDSSSYEHALTHVYWDGVAWQTETVAPGVSAYDIRLAVDQVDNLHLIYHDNDNCAVTYATNAGGDWLFEALETVCADIETDLVLDSQGRPHLIFHGQPWHQPYVRYARRLPTGWQVQPVKRIKPIRSALALDGLDQPVIAHNHLYRGGVYVTRGPVMTEHVFLPLVHRGAW